MEKLCDISSYPDADLGDHNYCRNPDGEPFPWCYNSQGTSPRWEYCDIPSCESPAAGTACTKGTVKWRDDGKCGKWNLLPDGGAAQCDPDGENPCCGQYGNCGNDESRCICTNCVDYRIVREIKKSGQTCTLVKLPSGFLKYVCFMRNQIYYKCINWDGFYKANYSFTNRYYRNEYQFNGVSEACKNDPHFYQACGFDTEITNTDVFCGGYICEYKEELEFVQHKYFKCTGDSCRSVNRRCGRSSYLTPEPTTQSSDPTTQSSDSTTQSSNPTTQSSDPTTQSSDLTTYSSHSTTYSSHSTTQSSDPTTQSSDPTTQSSDLTTYSSHSTTHSSHSTTQSSDPTTQSSDPTTQSSDLTTYSSHSTTHSSHSTTQSSHSTTQSSDPTAEPITTSKPSDGPKRKCVILVHEICDGNVDCVGRSEEENCTVTASTSHKCTHYKQKLENNKTRTVPILNYTRCSAFDLSPYKNHYPYCLNYLDQTNCSDIEQVGGYCKVNGHMSTVSKYMNCFEYDKRSKQPVTLCDDGMQNECIYPSTSDCRVHKHLMCDGVKDCADGSDEIHHKCSLTTEEIHFACERRFQPRISKSIIPISWIMDNVTDCMDGEDENPTLWVDCPGHAISPAEFPCQDVFFCPGMKGAKDTSSSVLLKHLCNGIESCGLNGGEMKVCRTARDFPATKTTAYMSSDSIRNVCSSVFCEKREFIRPWGKVLGEAKIEVLVPNRMVNCNRQFGENYLYLSCMGLCLEENAFCPLSGEDRKLKHNSCSGQYPDRAYTIANNSFLTFVKKSDTGQYHQNFFRCSNNRCIQYNEVCNLVDDCGDMSDETDCSNHMICADTENSTKHQFVSWSQKCDGIYDCFDLSDECNESCARQILGHSVLKCICWLMGILAVGFNLCSIFHGLNSIKDCRTAGMMATKVLLIFIALGDLLMGMYLIILSVYDSFIFRGLEYCQRQTEWLTGTACLVLGVISTVGSQVSLFSMTVFSFIRMYGLLYREMRIPTPADKKSLIKVVFMALAILISSLAVSVIPLVPSLEDFFVQGMYYDPSYKIFVGFPTKSRHIDVLEAYYKHSNRSFHGITEDMSWKDIEKKVNDMFSQEYGSLARKPVHFYGNDGVCLFKYFVRTDDARRNRQSSGSGVEMNDPVVWTMLVVNFMCFLIMTYCYIRIIRNTKKSAQSSGQYENPQRLRQSRTMYNRIMVIMVTDFLCWVPFIFISGLHNLGKINASSWYTSFAMTVLPLNSVINPLIYDKAIGEFILKHFSRLTAVIIPRNLSALGLIAGLFRTGNIRNEPEIIPMEAMNTQNDTVS